MAGKRIHLVIIDPQNDFCDLPEAYRPPGEAPALPVAGAHADMLRLAALIDRGGAGLTDISVTLDTHERLDIAHPAFWRQGDGAPFAPFTAVAAADVRAGRYLPCPDGAIERVLVYLDTLEAAGRYTHMVWPVHCELGSWGHAIHADVRRACNRWEEARLAAVAKVVKGTNPWTEHFSALQAEVPAPDDASTQLNAAFLARLQQADRILVAGEAGSHCVKASTEHLAAHLDPARLVLLTDCMSPVGGFEVQYRDFVADMRSRGVRIATAAEMLPELLANA